MNELISPEKAQEILNHLIKTGQGFCFYQGMLVDRMMLELIATGGEAE